MGLLEVVKDHHQSDAIEMKVDATDEVEVSEGGRPVGPGVRGDEAGTSDRRQLVAVATAVGAVSLLLGWVIGFTARSDPEMPAAATSTATSTATTESTVESSPVSETLPMPTTTRPRRTTTTTTLAPVVVEAVVLDPRLPTMELVLTGVAPINTHQELLELDLAERTLTRTDLGRISNVEWMMAGDDWTLIVTQQGLARVVRDGDPPEVVSHGEIWESRWDPRTGRFWQPDWDREWMSGPEVWVEHDFSGEPTGATVAMPIGGWPAMVDPRGGLVTDVAGKYYSIEPTGVTMIGSGRLLGLSSDAAVLWECDDQLRCGPQMIDRTTGERREVPVGVAGGSSQIEPLWGWGEIAAATIAPTGDACGVMLIDEEGHAFAVLDLDSGELTELAEPHWMPALAWSPDGRFVFHIVGEGASPSELWVLDRETGEAFSVFAESTRWDALSARPTAPGE